MTQLASRHHDPCRHAAYEMSCAQFEALFTMAIGRCQICGVEGSATPHGILVIDHDEKIGMHAVRGLLCSRCNTLLGRPGLVPQEVAGAYLAAPWHAGRPPRTRSTASAALVAAARVRQEAQLELEAARAALADLIRAEMGVGVRQVDIVKVTDYTREQIRRIVDAEYTHEEVRRIVGRTADSDQEA